MDAFTELWEKLVQRGFSVARRAYVEDRYWARDQEHRNYSVDVARGLYSRWGEPERWRPIDELLCGLQQRADAVHQVRTVRSDVGFFVAECLAAGLEWDEELNSGPTHTVTLHTKPIDLGNRWLRWREKIYLACESSKELIELGSRPLTSYTLPALIGGPQAAQESTGFICHLRELTTPPADTGQLKPRSLFG